jgi:hypothetical protein
MSKVVSKRLLVEGNDDLRVLPELIEKAGVPWGPKENPIVKIRQCDGVDELFASGVIATELKASGLSALGVIVDADDNAHSRWQQIKSELSDRFTNVPLSIPAGGVVLQQGGLKFGAWIMPDNSSQGMLETFLLYLQPHENPELNELAIRVTTEAKSVNAPFSENHTDKARIHSWLAWQDPPGCQLHIAILQNMMTYEHDILSKFITWFRLLYDIPT